jgi:oxygen-dependent protoporphyrinogen oxidase
VDKTSEALARELRSWEYAPLAVVHLGYARVPPQAPRGFGFLAPASEELGHLLGSIDVAATFPFRVPPGSGLWTCLCGGARGGTSVLERPDSVLEEETHQTLTRLVGPLPEPALVRVVRWPKAIPQYNIGHKARLFRVQALLQPLIGLHLLGNAYEGVGLNDCVRNASALFEDRFRNPGQASGSPLTAN